MIGFSYEVYPPRTAHGLTDLGLAIGELSATAPHYISVTYGAGGSECDNSFAAIDIARTHAAGVEIAAHLTCVGESRAEIDAILDRYQELGVAHVVALRGDPPSGIDAPYEPHPDGYQRTADLVAAIKARGCFDVAVSAYPEVHPQSPDLDHDLDVLAAKVDAGADIAMTQMFFDNEHFLRYRDAVDARGIEIPIVPGVFPIHDIAKVTSFAQRCGASVPAATTARFANVEPGSADAFRTAVDVAADQIAELARHGAPHIHLYTLNQADLALAIHARLHGDVL